MTLAASLASARAARGIRPLWGEPRPGWVGADRVVSPDERDPSIEPGHALAEAGVILETLHLAAADIGQRFP